MLQNYKTLHFFIYLLETQLMQYSGYNTRAHHGDEIPKRDVTYHLICLLIYHGTTTHL